MFRRIPKRSAFDRLRTCILSKWLLDADGPATVFAITSYSGRQGATTIVAGLARELGASAAGTTLVLDVAQGRRRVADYLKAEKRPLGFDSLGSGDPDLWEAIVHDDRHGIDILTLSGADRSTPGSAKRTRALIEPLRPDYSLILVDAGALIGGGASHWLASSSYRILVVDASAATRHVLEFQKKQFENISIRLDGSILNKRTFPIPRALYWLAR